METNMTIEQAIVEKNKSNREKNNTKNIPQKASLKHKETQGRNSYEFENGPMMTTSEILDFSSGIDSTEYDQRER